MDKVAHLYDEYIAASYAADPFDLFKSARTEARSQIERHISRPPQILVDLAVGTGEVLLDLSTRFPLAKGYGIDISSRMLELARDNLAARGPLVQLIQDDARQARNHVEVGTADLLVMHFLLAYIPDTPGILSLVGDLLRPGGIGSIASATYRNFPALQKMAALFVPSEVLIVPVPRDLEAFQRLLTDSQFEILESSEVETPVHFSTFEDLHEFGVRSGWFTQIFTQLAPEQISAIAQATAPYFPLHDVARLAVMLVGKAT